MGYTVVSFDIVRYLTHQAHGSFEARRYVCQELSHVMSKKFEQSVLPPGLCQMSWRRILADEHPKIEIKDEDYLEMDWQERAEDRDQEDSD